MIKSLQHIGMTVPDLAIARQFYTAFGLRAETRPSAAGETLILRCYERDQDQIVLRQAPTKKLSYISFGTDVAGFAQIEDSLRRLNIPTVAAPAGSDGGGLWFRDCVGDLINVQVREAAPSTAALPNEVNSPGRYRRIGLRGAATGQTAAPVHPRRLGHLIKFTPDVARSVAFYQEVLGLKISDQSPGEIAFLRAADGGDHHILGLAKSTHSGLHHLSFEVGSVDEIELGAQRLKSAGYKHAFGLGRHVAGSNFFHYFWDPWQSLVEYFWDIDVIAAGGDTWQAYSGTPQELTAVWSDSPMPEDFIHNYEPI